MSHHVQPSPQPKQQQAEAAETVKKMILSSGNFAGSAREKKEKQRKF